MPKLVIQIDHKFIAGPMLALNEKSQTKPLSAKKLKAMISGAEPGDFSLSISFLDLEMGSPCVVFEMTKIGLKKGGTFEFSIDEKKGVVTVCVKGEIASSPLRAGVAPFIQKMGKKADLRLVAFNYKGGEWSGFTAPIHAQAEEDYKNWYQIKTWSLK